MPGRVSRSSPSAPLPALMPPPPPSPVVRCFPPSPPPVRLHPRAPPLPTHCPPPAAPRRLRPSRLPSPRPHRPTPPLPVPFLSADLPPRRPPCPRPYPLYWPVRREARRPRCSSGGVLVPPRRVLPSRRPSTGWVVPNQPAVCPRGRGLPRRGPVGPREAAIIPLALRRVRNLGGTRGRGPEGPARPDLARRPIPKGKGFRAARVVR